MYPKMASWDSRVMEWTQSDRLMDVEPKYLLNDKRLLKHLHHLTLGSTATYMGMTTALNGETYRGGVTAQTSVNTAKTHYIE